MILSAIREVQVVVLAKSPVPGRVKTRLTPPLTPDQAAHVATAALTDTLRAVAAAPVRRRVLVLDGDVGPWLPAGFDVVKQRPGPLDARIEFAFSDVVAGGTLPTLLIGMDTPQVTPHLLSAAADELLRGAIDAVLGLADDGGFWALGVARLCPGLVHGVAMSEPSTGDDQLGRLKAGGLRVGFLPALRDVDTVADLDPVAALAPMGTFASAVRSLRDIGAFVGNEHVA